MVENIIKKNRSYRRFNEQREIAPETLKELISLARYAPSAANRQPLKYIISHEQEKNEKIFPCLSWAGYLENWTGPEPGERPAAYVIILNDNEINQEPEAAKTDVGIAAQSILLGAVRKDLGGCIFGAIDRKKLRQNLDIQDRYDIMNIIALGEPDEKIVLETSESKEDIKYWRDEQGVHHVPKRPLNELILNS